MKTMHICQPGNIKDWSENKDLNLYRTGWIKELYVGDYVDVYIKGNRMNTKRYIVLRIEVKTYQEFAHKQEFLDEIKAYNRKFDPRHFFIKYRLKNASFL